jgi:hypothetical protein
MHEELSDSDLTEAIALCKETRPKLVISHTTPSEGKGNSQRLKRQLFSKQA